MRTLPKSCTTQDAAKRLRVAVSTVQTWVEAGYLEAWKTPGGHRRIPLSSLDRLMQSGMVRHDTLPFRILIVEDDASMRSIYEGHIASWKLPVSVELTSDGHDGLVRAVSAPDVLITDLSMPGISGFRMVRALRDSTTAKSLPIIAVSGLPLDEVLEGGELPPDVHLMSKPVNFPELKRMLLDIMFRRPAVAH
jgi:excisionase family DNA binding protein